MIKDNLPMDSKGLSIQTAMDRNLELGLSIG
jgi:hypothetical protein